MLRGGSQYCSIAASRSANSYSLIIVGEISVIMSSVLWNRMHDCVLCALLYDRIWIAGMQTLIADRVPQGLAWNV